MPLEGAKNTRLEVLQWKYLGQLLPVHLGTHGCLQWEVFSHPPQLLSSCSWDPSLFSAVMYPQSLWFGWMLPQCQHAPPKCYCQPKPSGAYSDCPDRFILKMWQYLCLYFKPILCTVPHWFCMNIFEMPWFCMRKMYGYLPASLLGESWEGVCGMWGLG